jgi:hypothetical protein
MFSFTLRGWKLGNAIFAGLIWTTPAAAQQTASLLDFSLNGVGWVGLNGNGPFFEPGPGRLPPVAGDPAHPFVPNGAEVSRHIGSLISAIRT